MWKKDYAEYMYDRNRKGSGKASSYIRALDLLGEILPLHTGPFQHIHSLWVIDDIESMESLYEYLLKQQKTGEIFQTDHSPSYWKDGYYSASVQSYMHFLIEHKFANTLSAVYTQNPKFNHKHFEIDPEHKNTIIKGLSTKHGKDVLAQLKQRVGQTVFRKEILQIYNHRCCLTGLQVPDVLRASHILGWAENTEQRMNLQNGLCLSATYDVAFDKKLISFDEEYRLILSPFLAEFTTNQAYQEYFSKFKGTQIALPHTHIPDQKFLAKHRELLRQ